MALAKPCAKHSIAGSGSRTITTPATALSSWSSRQKERIDPDSYEIPKLDQICRSASEGANRRNPHDPWITFLCRPNPG